MAFRTRQLNRLLWSISSHLSKREGGSAADIAQRSFLVTNIAHRQSSSFLARLFDDRVVRKDVLTSNETTVAEHTVSGTAARKNGPCQSYNKLTEEGKLHPGDNHQKEALCALQLLFDVLVGTNKEGEAVKPSNKMGLWSNWLPMHKQTMPSTKGLYLFGGVGTGKTMLMDMFYNELPSWLSKKRIHFHDFMISVHTKLQSFKGVSDPLKKVADELSSESRILCLDEFMVTDVADAMILHRLFTHLFANGVILVSTSNRHPDNLYEKGLQRDLFLPFIALLKNKCIVHEIGSSIDYRRQTLIQQGLFFTGNEAAELLKEKVALLTDGAPGEQVEVELAMGRFLHVPFAAKGVAVFMFHDLCERPLGAADFIGLVRQFHTVALEGIPIFGASNRSAAYRFVTLVDVMYEHKAQLVCAAEGRPFELFEKIVTIANAPKRTSSRLHTPDDADLAVDDVLGFAKERTISRMIEMQSVEYQEVHSKQYRLQ